MSPVLEPFPGVRYSSADDLRDLTCPPYDVISPEEQAQLYGRHPLNAVRLELPLGDDPATRAAAAAAAFGEWMASGVLERDDRPALYVYRQDFVVDGARRTVTGVIGGLVLEEFGESSGVLPHERTMPGPKADRLALMNACAVNISPIYAIYRGAGSLEPFFQTLENRPAAGRFQDDAGILHRLWVIQAAAEIETLADAVGSETLVIADGHHRYETALEYHRQRDASPGAHHAIMTFCVDADAADLVVLPYNRIVDFPEGVDALGDALVERFDATEIAGDAADALESSESEHAFVFVLPARRLLVEVSDERVKEAVGDRAPAWRALDVVALHEVVLPEVLAMEGATLRFSKDPDEVTRLVTSGDATAGVLLRALRATDVVEVARSGERMPQKASYFWPKAVTGLAFRELS